MTIRFLHFPYPGGGTVAYDVTDTHINLAVALCHSNDQFNRRKGRLISAGRFKLAFEQGSTRPCVSYATRIKRSYARPITDQVADAVIDSMTPTPLTF